LFCTMRGSLPQLASNVQQPNSKVGSNDLFMTAKHSRLLREHNPELALMRMNLTAVMHAARTRPCAPYSGGFVRSRTRYG
jgi:hypothetical protein